MRVRANPREMAMKGYYTFPKVPGLELWHHTQDNCSSCCIDETLTDTIALVKSRPRKENSTFPITPGLKPHQMF